MSSRCSLNKCVKDYIEWLRGNDHVFAGYSRDESVELVNWLAAEGVLFQLGIRAALPRDELIDALIDDYFERNKRSVWMKLQKMRDFNRAARENNLHGFDLSGRIQERKNYRKSVSRPALLVCLL